MYLSLYQSIPPHHPLFDYRSLSSQREHVLQMENFNPLKRVGFIWPLMLEFLSNRSLFVMLMNSSLENRSFQFQDERGLYFFILLFSISFLISNPPFLFFLFSLFFFVRLYLLPLVPVEKGEDVNSLVEKVHEIMLTAQHKFENDPPPKPSLIARLPIASAFVIWGGVNIFYKILSFFFA